MTAPTFLNLVLLRGSRPNQFDRPATCVFFTGITGGMRPLAATWVELCVLENIAKIYTPTAAEQIVCLSNNGRTCSLPVAWSEARGLPRITCWKAAGLVESADIERELKTRKSETLLVGSTEWRGSDFVASPMGLRTSGGQWSVFAPSGGKVALELQWPLSETQAFGQESLPQAQALYAAVDLFTQRHPVQPDGDMVTACETRKDALTLVIMRMAWGSIKHKVVVPKGAAPGWKRLLQHLGATHSLLPSTSSEGFNVTTFWPSVAPVGEDRLSADINRHSQVIPEKLL